MIKKVGTNALLRKLKSSFEVDIGKFHQPGKWKEIENFPVAS